jgi:arsenate reductase
MHISFEDPAKATGSQEEILGVYRKIRDQIREQFLQFYKTL